MAGEKTLRDLVAEYKSSALSLPAYRADYATRLLHRARPTWVIRLLEVLEFRTGSTACHPAIEALALGTKRFRVFSANSPSALRYRTRTRSGGANARQARC